MLLAHALNWTLVVPDAHPQAVHGYVRDNRSMAHYVDIPRTWALAAPGEAPLRNALDVHISRVRRRVAEVGLHIRTVRGRGYLMDAPSDSGQQLAANG